MISFLKIGGSTIILFLFVLFRRTEAILKEMSTIYSAGQFEDAFSPKRLGNWEASPKNELPSLQLKPEYPSPGTKTQAIVDDKGHLLPGVPRNKSTAWPLLQYYMRKNTLPNMTVLSGPGKPQQESTESSSPYGTKLKKLPRYIPKKARCSQYQKDHLMEYLKELGLPIVWIIGPATKRIFNKRKQFSTQLAKSLRFGYVNLDEKIQEWKERQSTCTCSATQLKSKASSAPTFGYGGSLALTSIAPSKLPTSVPPQLSEHLPTTRNPSAVPDLSELLETQRITFDTALPIERNKILELYKFAMAECLPCEGFVFDSVPFDLVEGLSFEKSFYPAALAIYFAEGAPKKNQFKTKDRLTASSITGGFGTPKKMGPLQYLEFRKKAKAGEVVYPRTKNHKRLGAFSLTEAEKICRQFGSKTIRIINAEEVERDTMDFLNELVKKNLENYQQILDGNAKLDCNVSNCGRHYFRVSSSSTVAAGQSTNLPPSAESTHYSYASSFIPEGNELDEEESKQSRSSKTTASLPIPAAELDILEISKLSSEPKVTTGTSSQTSPSMFNLPEIYQPSPPCQVSQTSQTPATFSSPPQSQEEKGDMGKTEMVSYVDEVGGGNHTKTDNVGVGSGPLSRKQSLEILQKINKLASKVAELNPEKNNFPTPSLDETEDSLNADNIGLIPPPTAYADEDEVETLTSVIRRAMARQAQSDSRPREQSQITEQNYDFGASGDYADISPTQVQRQRQRQEEKPQNAKDQAEASEGLLYFEEQFLLLENNLKRKQEKKSREKRMREEDEMKYPNNEDPFFDD